MQYLVQNAKISSRRRNKSMKSIKIDNQSLCLEKVQPYLLPDKKAIAFISLGKLVPKRVLLDLIEISDIEKWCCVLYEEGIHYSPLSKDDRKEQSQFFRWRELIEVTVFRLVDQKGKNEGIGDVKLVFTDNYEIVLSAHRLSTYFFYPIELPANDLIDNMIRLKTVNFDIVRILFIIFRRAFKARWTGNVPVQEWLR
jgi:hypothetical protein